MEALQARVASTIPTSACIMGLDEKQKSTELTVTHNDKTNDIMVGGHNDKSGLSCAGGYEASAAANHRPTSGNETHSTGRNPRQCQARAANKGCRPGRGRIEMVPTSADWRAGGVDNTTVGKMSTTTASLSTCRPSAVVSKQQVRWSLVLLALSVHLLLAAPLASLATEPSPDTSLQAGYLDPACAWTSHQEPGELGWILMVLKCDMGPMLSIFEQLLPHFGGPRHFNVPSDLDGLKGVEHTESAARTWREYLSLTGLIGAFFESARQAIRRREFCTYQNVRKFGELRQFAISSAAITTMYDLIAIDFHTHCLEETLKKLPQVPYLVRDIVQIYFGSAGKFDLNEASPRLGEADVRFEFDADTAIEENGPLSEVSKLLLRLPPLDGGSVEEQFKQQCHRLLVELEDRWQTMEMMNEMLATDSNAIRHFNNYIVRLLMPTRYADACSQLSLRS